MEVDQAREDESLACVDGFVRTPFDIADTDNTIIFDTDCTLDDGLRREVQIQEAASSETVTASEANTSDWGSQSRRRRPSILSLPLTPFASRPDDGGSRCR